MQEFRDRFLPESPADRLLENSEEAKALGASMARESISKIKLVNTNNKT